MSVGKCVRASGLEETWPQVGGKHLGEDTVPMQRGNQRVNVWRGEDLCLTAPAGLGQGKPEREREREGGRERERVLKQKRAVKGSGGKVQAKHSLEKQKSQSQ